MNTSALGASALVIPLPTAAAQPVVQTHRQRGKYPKFVVRIAPYRFRRINEQHLKQMAERQYENLMGCVRYSSYIAEARLSDALRIRREGRPDYGLSQFLGETRQERLAKGEHHV